jgi:glycosyltransferase involved in cell wall biosynthesis
MIVYVANDLKQMTGGPQAAKDILIALLTTNHQVTVISNERCLLLKQIDGKTLSSPHWLLPVKEVPFSSRISKNLPVRIAEWAKKKLLNFQQNQYLRQLNPALIIVNGLGSHLLWKRIKPRLNGKIVLIIHESPRHFCPPSSKTVNWALEAMSQYDAFIFVSSNCRDEWLALGEFNDKESYYIPNCCKEEKVSRLISQDRTQVRQRLGIPANKFVAVCVASLQPRKNQNLLVELFPQLIKIVPNLKLYLIGPITVDPKWASSLLQKIKEDGFDEQIKYLGAREDAIDFIYAADLFLLPSLAEAMPLVILEAMALKTPVIASDVDGIPELIENEMTGLLFSPAHPQSFVDVFTQMSTNPDKRRLFAERAYQRYWSEFSRLRQIERYKKIIMEAMSGE